MSNGSSVGLERILLSIWISINILLNICKSFVISTINSGILARFVILNQLTAQTPESTVVHRKRLARMDITLLGIVIGAIIILILIRGLGFWFARTAARNAYRNGMNREITGRATLRRIHGQGNLAASP